MPSGLFGQAGRSVRFATGMWCRHGTGLLAGLSVGLRAQPVLGSCQGWRCHYSCRTTARGRPVNKTISAGDGGVMWPNRQIPPGQQEVDEKSGTVRRPDSILAAQCGCGRGFGDPPLEDGRQPIRRC